MVVLSKTWYATAYSDPVSNIYRGRGREKDNIKEMDKYQCLLDCVGQGSAIKSWYVTSHDLGMFVVIVSRKYFHSK